MPPDTGEIGRLGILAGGGDLPARIAASCRAEGIDFFIIAFEGQADPALVEGNPHAWVRLGAAGATLDILKREGVSSIVMAGRVRRPSLKALRPDRWAASFFVRNGAAALGDDGLLKALVRELEQKESFRVIGVESLLPEILAPSGALGAIVPDDQALADIRRGREVAWALGALDIGQGAVVAQGLVLAVEAIEGTDAMLQRVGELKREGPGGVLVKMAKPGQERRADLPSIGPRTVKMAAEAGLRGIAVEAGGALIVDHEEVVRRADAAGLFIFGIKAEEEIDA